jgi:hypothetical protein
MYSINVTQFYDPDSESDTLPDSTYEYIKEYIAKNVYKNYTGAIRDYLLYCAEWYPQPHNERLWIAYSPIKEKEYYPLGSINLTYSHDNVSLIEFVSSTGKTEPFLINYLPEGNLPTINYSLKTLILKEKNKKTKTLNDDDNLTYDYNNQFSIVKNFKGTITIN